jgi:hypothetical protein
MAAPTSAKTIIRNALAEFGLGALADFAWKQYLQSGASDVSTAMTIIMPSIRERPEYKARFPAMDSLAAKGRAITESDYVAYERQVTELFRAAGLPQGFYDQPADFKKFLENSLSPSEIQERVQNAQTAIYNAAPAVKQQLHELYGVGASPGDVTAYFLDPDRAEPLLNRRLAAAQISGRGVESGYGALERPEAEAVADRGLSQEAIDQGFQNLEQTRELFHAQVGAHDLESGGITREEQLGAAFLGDEQASEVISREQRTRKANTSGGGGGFATDKAGVSGLGKAAA